MTAIVVIAASTGSLAPLRLLIAALPSRCLAAIFIVSHIGANRSMLPSLLDYPNKLPAAFAEDRGLIEVGHVYVAPPDHHMLLGQARIRLNRAAKVHFTRPAADPLFFSAAEIHGKQVMGIVLSGWGSDGAAGLRSIKQRGGTALVQHPGEAVVPGMPGAALMADHPDACLSIQDIAGRAHAFCSSGRALPA